jgi:excisionase family DNA binding protein
VGVHETGARPLREAFTLSERETLEPEILTLKQAAALLKVNTHQIPKLIRREGLPAYRLGKQWRFRRSELLAWLTRQRESA